MTFYILPFILHISNLYHKPSRHKFPTILSRKLILSMMAPSRKTRRNQGRIQDLWLGGAWGLRTAEGPQRVHGTALVEGPGELSPPEALGV